MSNNGQKPFQIDGESLTDIFHPDSIKTKNGYDFYEVVSALQKEIRRGNEFEALYWALEAKTVTLDTSSGKMKQTEAIQYIWHRLAVTASEEIGMIDPQALILVQNCRQAHTTGRPDDQILAFAVLYLTRSPKNREVNDYVAYVGVHRDKLNLRLEMPDYAVDTHTYRGKVMGRRVDFWWKEGRKINNRKGVNKYFKYIYEFEGKGHSDWAEDELKEIEKENEKNGIKSAEPLTKPITGHFD